MTAMDRPEVAAMWDALCAGADGDLHALMTYRSERLSKAHREAIERLVFTLEAASNRYVEAQKDFLKAFFATVRSEEKAEAAADAGVNADAEGEDNTNAILAATHREMGEAFKDLVKVLMAANCQMEQRANRTERIEKDLAETQEAQEEILEAQRAIASKVAEQHDSKGIIPKAFRDAAINEVNKIGHKIMEFQERLERLEKESKEEAEFCMKLEEAMKAVERSLRETFGEFGDFLYRLC